MIDLTPEQVIEQQLVECGLNPNSFTVIYEDYLQSIEIFIKPEAGATFKQFDCIRKASGSEIVTFADLEMYRRYSDYVMELFRPKMLEDSRQSLDKIGKLSGFPKRASFASENLFAEAIEVHCGIPAGSALKLYGGGIVFTPPTEDYENIEIFIAKYSCLTTAISYVAAKRELHVGIIGNEATREENEQ